MASAMVRTNPSTVVPLRTISTGFKDLPPDNRRAGFDFRFGKIWKLKPSLRRQPKHSAFQAGTQAAHYLGIKASLCVLFLHSFGHHYHDSPLFSTICLLASGLHTLCCKQT